MKQPRTIQQIQDSINQTNAQLLALEKKYQGKTPLPKLYYTRKAQLTQKLEDIRGNLLRDCTGTTIIRVIGEKNVPVTRNTTKAVPCEILLTNIDHKLAEVVMKQFFSEVSKITRIVTLHAGKVYQYG